MKRSYLVFGLIFFVLLLDQILKIWVKLTFPMGHDVALMGDWFHLHFIENEGMAFGITLWGDYGKLILSLFRIVAVVFIGFYLRNLIRNQASYGLLTAISLIFAGAVGNIIDSAFYGLIFNDPINMHGGDEVAKLVPFGTGYAGFLHGKVVDMLYFPIYKGENFTFFQAIFNLADASISIGVFLIIVFYKRFFGTPKVEPTPEVVVMGTVPYNPEQTEQVEEPENDISETPTESDVREEKEDKKE